MDQNGRGREGNILFSGSPWNCTEIQNNKNIKNKKNNSVEERKLIKIMKN